jgi:hypothetical protein
VIRFADPIPLERGLSAERRHRIVSVVSSAIAGVMSVSLTGRVASIATGSYQQIS